MINNGFFYAANDPQNVMKTIDNTLISSIFDNSPCHTQKYFFSVIFDNTHDWTQCDAEIINTVLNILVPFKFIVKHKCTDETPRWSKRG